MANRTERRRKAIQRIRDRLKEAKADLDHEYWLGDNELGSFVEQVEESIDTANEELDWLYRAVEDRARVFMISADD